MDNLESEGEGNKKKIEIFTLALSRVVRLCWDVFTNARRMRCNPSWNIIAVGLGFTFLPVVTAVQLCLLSGQ